MKQDVYDITFIGAGPVGLYGMYYAGLRLMKTKTIDMLSHVGGSLSALYPEKYIYDVAGFPKVLAKDLVKLLKKQGTQYPHDMLLGEKVLRIRPINNLIRIETDKGIHISKTIIVCTGAGSYVPRRLDTIPNIDEFENVSYFINALEKFRDKTILIVGGGDAAFDSTIMLEPIAKYITHIHRNRFFSAHEASVSKVQNFKNVQLLYPCKLESIKRCGSKITTILNKTGTKFLRDVNAIILNLGFVTDSNFVKTWGLTIKEGKIKVDSKMQTNIKGVFAAGDAIIYDGKLKLISTGFGEVATAVNNAKNYINPKVKVYPGHSTDKHERIYNKWRNK